MVFDSGQMIDQVLALSTGPNGHVFAIDVLNFFSPFCSACLEIIGVKFCHRRTDRKTNSLTPYTGYYYFFFQLNLLSPFLLRSQVDHPKFNPKFVFFGEHLWSPEQWSGTSSSNHKPYENVVKNVKLLYASGLVLDCLFILSKVNFIARESFGQFFDKFDGR